MNCPKCDAPIGSKSYCACGWREEGKSSSKSQGISDCEWVSDRERCHYPGTISNHTNGTGPFYCHFHAMTGISAAYGAKVVAESGNYKPRTMAERHHDAVFGKYTGPKACKERTCIKHALRGSDFCLAHSRQPEHNSA